jgi:hypothetical protein
MHSPAISWARVAATLLAFAAFGIATEIRAQSIEPRTYSNVPVGLNFILVGFQNSRGALDIDPNLPIDDVDADVDVGFIGYLTSLDVAGNSAKLGLVVPYASLVVDGTVNGEFREREIDDFADPSFIFSYNFHGAPALSPQEFRSYRQDLIAGFTVTVTAPLGQYDSDKLINLSTNRWTIRPEIGVSKAVGKWALETSAGIAYFTDNDDFNNGQKREQDPIYSVQFHVTYNFPNNVWLAGSTTYYEGGETTIDSVERDDLQENWRTGLTLALPVDRNHSIKLYGSKGVSTRTGADFDIAGVVWQYRWGGDF